MSTLGRITKARIYGGVVAGTLPDEKKQRRGSLEKDKERLGVSMDIGAAHAEEFYQKQIHHHQNNAVSLGQTVQAAAESMAGNLQRIKELMKQIQKDSLSAEDRPKIQGKLSELISGLKDNLESEFNGKALFTPHVVESIGGGFMLDLINGKIFFDAENFFREDSDNQEKLVESIEVLIKRLNTGHLDADSCQSAADAAKEFFEEIASVPRIRELEGTREKIRKLSGGNGSLNMVKDFLGEIAEVSKTLDLKKIEDAKNLLKDSMNRIRNKEAEITQLHNEIETDTAAVLLYA